jgi:hypothetical protein
MNDKRQTMPRTIHLPICWMYKLPSGLGREGQEASKVVLEWMELSPASSLDMRVTWDHDQNPPRTRLCVGCCVYVARFLDINFVFDCAIDTTNQEPKPLV